MGFNVASKMVMHNVAHAINKILLTERMHIFENPKNAILFNQIITLVNFWVGDVIFTDSVLLSAIIDIIEILIKSGTSQKLF